MDYARIEKKIRTRKIIVQLSLAGALISMAADMVLTRNFFVHTLELMMLSFALFGVAFFAERQIHTLRQRKLKK